MFPIVWPGFGINLADLSSDANDTEIPIVNEITTGLVARQGLVGEKQKGEEERKERRNSNPCSATFGLRHPSKNRNPPPEPDVHTQCLDSSHRGPPHTCEHDHEHKGLRFQYAGIKFNPW